MKRSTAIKAAIIAVAAAGLFLFLGMRHGEQPRDCTGTAAELGQVQRELDDLDAKSTKLFRRKLELLEQLKAGKP